MTRVKICGFTHPDDVRAGIAAGVDAFGFNFARGPRRISPEQAAELTCLLPPLAYAVALFVDADEATIRQAMRISGCRAVQLHGDEAPELARSLRRDFSVIRAIRVRDAASLDAAAAFPCDMLLLDAWSPDSHGGTGTAFDHTLLQDWRPPVPIMLAGGLRPENVGEAVRRVRPFAVDCSSGVERETARKDPGLMHAFVRNVRQADCHAD